MKLVIGGHSQGKLNFTLREYGADHALVSDGEIPGEKQLQEIRRQDKTVIINHFHLWVKERIIKKGNPEEEIRSFLEQDADIIIISDEIGNGIVPADVFEREYRERTGRILVSLADRADEVVRVICGIGQRIK